MVMRSHYHISSHRTFPGSVMASLEIESTLTDRYQTTVPDAVRRTLKLRKRDKIRYVVRPDGAVPILRSVFAPRFLFPFPKIGIADDQVS